MQYRTFGTHIKGLAENLHNISQVVDNAKATWTQRSLQYGLSRGLPTQKEWDLSSLREIIGDYHQTLIDCEKVLQENPEVRKNRSFAYNLDWNVIVQPKMERLQKRLKSHSTKILILLKPLELKLLSEVHHDLVERIDAVHRSVLHLQGLLIRDIEQAMSEQQSLSTVPRIVVPEAIETKFQITAGKFRPKPLTQKNFPLRAGADAFIEHFQTSTKSFPPENLVIDRMPPPKQYLSLLKCIWIMSCLEVCDALKASPAGSLWPGYIAQLHEDLLSECLRFTAPSAQRLVAPTLLSILDEDSFRIWPDENFANYLFPHHKVYIEEVLKITLPSPSEALEHDMNVYQLDATTYRIVESVREKEAQAIRREDFTMDIDLRTVKLTPIYATPGSTPKPLELLINSSTAQCNLTFQKLKHIHRLQHLSQDGI